MSTRSFARRLLSPIEDPERLLSRKNQSEPSLLLNLEEDDMAGQVPPQGPIPDLRLMEELLQAPTDGVGDNNPKLDTLREQILKLQTSETNLQVASAIWSSTTDALVTALTKQVEALLSSFKQPVNFVQNGSLHERPQGALPSNTKPNPREQVNSITTRSGLTTAEPSIPPPVPPTPRVEVEKEPETLMDEVPKKLEDPEKFLIPCILQDLEVYNFLADSGASINLMPLSFYEKLGVGPLKPTRMTLELANHYVTFPMGIAEDVIIKVKKFNFLADFIIVDFKADPRFADELAHHRPFPPGNEDDNFDPEVDRREIEYLLNRDPSTVSSPTIDIDIVDPVLERFTDEPLTLFTHLQPGDDMITWLP
ncbi:reverse transcriptase domain-containing protein [Tanacetum coccineum]